MQVGQKVSLITGGPLMIIHKAPNKQNEVLCQWFNENELKEAYFHVHCLKLHQKEVFIDLPLDQEKDLMQKLKEHVDNIDWLKWEQRMEGQFIILKRLNPIKILLRKYTDPASELYDLELLKWEQRMEGQFAILKRLNPIKILLRKYTDPASELYDLELVNSIKENHVGCMLLTNYKGMEISNV